jgi:hypothetical protein
MAAGGMLQAFEGEYGREKYVLDANKNLLEKDDPQARILDWEEVGVDENILKNREFQNRSRPFDLKEWR